jgi:hypothetical protein
MPKWDWLRANFEGFLSLCISRSKLSDSQILKRIKECAPDIVQADGIAMSGGRNDYAATLQTVALAQMLQNLDVYVILSGGTNSKTAELPKLCDVSAHGVAAGSFARQINTIKEAKWLINENLKYLPRKF